MVASFRKLTLCSLRTLPSINRVANCYLQHLHVLLSSCVVVNDAAIAGRRDSRLGWQKELVELIYAGIDAVNVTLELYNVTLEFHNTTLSSTTPP